MSITLRKGPDINWRSKCQPGDNQGELDACSVFAIASFAECMLGTAIPDEAAINVWRAERQFRYRDLTGGLTIPEAFAAAIIRGRWLPHGTTMRRVTCLDSLPLAPLVAGIADVNWAAGRATGDLSVDLQGTLHAALLVGQEDGFLWFENSYGSKWGRGGFGWMGENRFTERCTQLWQIILPNAPATLSEAARRQAESLSSQIGDQVRSIARHLQTLGYSLPGDGRVIMADIIRRSMAGQLSPAQQDARRDVTDVYLILMGSGITDAQINAVWDVVK
jgi:hypothetical protein